MLLRDLIRLLEDERPRLGWWAVLVVLSVAFAALELVGSLAVLALMRLFLDADPSTALEVAGLQLPVPFGWDTEQIRIGFAVGLVALFALRAVVMVLVSYLGARLSTMASVRIAQRLLDGHLHLPYIEHTRRRSSDMVRDTFVSTERLHEKATLPLTALATDAIVTVGLVTALLLVDPVTTAIAGVLLTAATVTVQRVVRPRLHRWSEQAQGATSASLESLQQAYSGLRDIRLLGQESRFLLQHDTERRRLARYRYLTAATQSVPRSLVELATIATLALVLIIAGTGGAGTIDLLPVLALFAYVGLRLQPVLNRVIRHLNEIRSSQGLIDDLRRELEMLGASMRRAEAHDGLGPRSDDIVLRGVSFSYPEAGHSGPDEEPRGVLQDVDLVIPAGSFVGIVGPTGGGKSTLLDLIVGLLTPTSGTVSAGGRTLGESPAWWWSRLGVVSQAVYLAPTTVRENVAFGATDPWNPGTEERIWASLEAAELAETIRGLPGALDATVGEGGVRLSGGQRQRLALARALFRDPPVIVLDEATSALDPDTEATVMSRVRPNRDAARRKTLVVVTHRPATVQEADLIVTVDSGRLTVRNRSN